MNPIPKQDTRCQFIYANGRRCRMQKMEGHPSLCSHHRRREVARLRQQEDDDTDAVNLGAEIVGPDESLNDAWSINRVLGNLFRALAHNRIPARNAAVLAYIAQLLLNSLPHLRAENQELEEAVRQLCASPYTSVAAPGFIQRQAARAAEEFIHRQTAGAAEGKRAHSEPVPVAEKEPAPGVIRTGECATLENRGRPAYGKQGNRP